VGDRAHYLHLPTWQLLNQACVTIRAAFGTPYLVGSATERADWRDVDLRVIIADDEFQAMFAADPARAPHFSPRWAIVCALISKQLSDATGLPIDFQIQSYTQAGEYAHGMRQPLGFYEPLVDPAPAPGVAQDTATPGADGDTTDGGRHG